MSKLELISDCNGIWTPNVLVRNQTLNHLTKLAMSVISLSTRMLPNKNAPWVKGYSLYLKESMVDRKTLMDKYEKGTCDIQPFVQPCKIHFFHKAIFLLSYYLQWNYMLEVQLYWKLICILRLHFSRIKACFWEKIGANIKKLFFAEVKDCSFESQRLQSTKIKILYQTFEENSSFHFSKNNRF